MGIKFFGHYLLDEGKLTTAQLTEAIAYQSSNNLSLGELAIRDSLISEKEANTINDKQRILDKRFGEVAISLGLLTDSQINDLLATQKKEKIFFGEILILKKFMSEETLNSELKKFEELQHIEVEELEDKIDEIDTDGLIKNSIGILQKLYSRIVHDHIKLVNIRKNSTQGPNGVIVLQKMRGDIHLDFTIASDTAVSLAISEKFMKMDFSEIDEMVLDIVSEFVNVILGNIAVKLGTGGTKVNLTPPVVLTKLDTSFKEYYAFDFVTTQGNLTLWLKV